MKVKCLPFKIQERQKKVVTGPQLRMHDKKYFSYFSTKTCVGYSKEQSQRDGSFEHPKHMSKMMDKKIIEILLKFFFA